MKIKNRLPLPDPGGQPFIPVGHSFSGLAGHVKNQDIRIHLTSHYLALFGIEIHIGQKIHFVKEHDVRVVKHGWIFERLVLALSYTQNDDLVVFAQIERSRTDKVSHILDQENIQGIQVKVLKGVADHMGIQMAPGSGVNLPNRNPGGSDPHRVIVSLLVALDYSKPNLLPKVMQGTLQDGGLAGSGRTDKIQHKDTLAKKEVPVFPRQTIVLGQDVCFNSNFPGSFRLAMAVGVTMAMMVMVMFMVVIVVMVLLFRGASAYSTHGISQPPFLSPATLHRI